MKGIRKQLQILSALTETILNYRLQPFEGLEEHLNIMLKKIKTMISSNQFQEGISEMLVSKENYQIKNKINKLRVQNINKNQTYVVEIKISVYEKNSSSLFNSEKWEFVINFEDNHTQKLKYYQEGIVKIIEFVLKNLLYLSILPLNQSHRNKYMIDHKVLILPYQSNTDLSIYQNISSQEFYFGKQKGKITGKIGIKYFYNDNKIQQNIKEIINERCQSSISSSQKKYSIASTQCSNRRISLYQHYDDELDITVLSNQDLGTQNQQIIEIEDEEEFQLLMEETEQLTNDQEFLKNNYEFFKELSATGYEYF